MIENLSPTINYGPPMLSTVDVMYRAWGPIGPVLYFLTSWFGHSCPDMDTVENLPSRA